MWDEVVKESAAFGSAVLTGIDERGYPVSIRCVPVVDPTGQERLVIELPSGVEFSSGRAGLLYHRHDEDLWNLRSFIVRGRLDLGGEGTAAFTPERFVGGAGIGGIRGMLRFVRGGRRTAKRYLAHRGLERPKIQWAWVKGLWAEVDAHSAHPGSA